MKIFSPLNLINILHQVFYFYLEIVIVVCNKNDFDPSEIIALYFVLVLLVSKVQVQGILYQN